MTQMLDDINRLFVKSSLVPTVVQHAANGRVLMLGYVNREALEKTLETGMAWFWSRSRNKLWNKGETSGHFLRVLSVYADCDEDALLYVCQPAGPTCHTGEISCFFRKVSYSAYSTGASESSDSDAEVSDAADVAEAAGPTSMI